MFSTMKMKFNFVVEILRWTIIHKKQRAHSKCGNIPRWWTLADLFAFTLGAFGAEIVHWTMNFPFHDWKISSHQKWELEFYEWNLIKNASTVQRIQLGGAWNWVIEELDSLQVPALLITSHWSGNYTARHCHFSHVSMSLFRYSARRIVIVSVACSSASFFKVNQMAKLLPLRSRQKRRRGRKNQ